LSSSLPNSNAFLLGDGNSGKIASENHDWDMHSEIDMKNREIKQLREAIWAHQNQNASLLKEIERCRAEKEAALQLKSDTIARTQNELQNWKQRYQSLRHQHLIELLSFLNPKASGPFADLQRIKKEYFFSLAIAFKLHNARDDNCMVNVGELYERALGEAIQWQLWPEWISEQIMSKLDSSS